jgi:hypothetical protein
VNIPRIGKTSAMMYVELPVIVAFGAVIHTEKERMIKGNGRHAIQNVTMPGLCAC